MNEPTETTDWHDRLIDRALAEHLGDETPPDLSERILAAVAADDPLSPLPPDTDEVMADSTPNPPYQTTPARLMLAASLLVALGAGGWWASEHEARNQQIAKSDDVRVPVAEAEVASVRESLSELSTLDGLAVVPVPEEPPIVYPEQEEWARLAAKRKRYESADQASNQPAKPVAGVAIVRDRAEADEKPVPGGGRYAGLSDQISVAPEVRYAAPTQPSSQPAVALGKTVESIPGNDKSEALGDAFAFTDVPDQRNRHQQWDWLEESGEKTVNGRYRGVGDLPALREIVTEEEAQVEELRKQVKQRQLAVAGANTSEARGVALQLASISGELKERERRLGRLQQQIQQVEGQGPGQGGDQYTAIHENPFIETRGEQAVSTFSIDVDTASYANVRQFLNAGQLPPADAVRLEELINYFDYDYPAPSQGAQYSGDETPFAAAIETTACPWKPEHRLVRIGVKGREVENRPQTNLVFLIDVSGSMNESNKHPLVIEGLKALAQQLGENDRVAIVVYASSEGLALPSTPGDDQETILGALDSLRAGGSTAGGAGIRLAYQIAEDNFIEGGANRVILCTDGDFNVGATSTGALEKLVAEKAKQTGVFLSVCGFGRGNLNDAMMETISGRGNGEYYYVDGPREAERVFVKGLTGTLVTIAKDVKIQVEFNPAKVAGYRLLGYENRMLRTQDFNDDKKDAGEIGAGHTVTALYEIVPAGDKVPAPPVDDLKYQATPGVLPDAMASGEILTLKMRYKQPDGDVSTKREWPVTDPGKPFAQASTDLQFAAAVASFGMQLRGSKHAGNASYDAVIEIADSAKGDDPEGERAEFVALVKKAKRLTGERVEPAANE